MKRFVATLVSIILLMSCLVACDNSAEPIRGESAYEIAVRNGFVGSEAEWLASLNGKDGADGENGNNGADGTDGRSIISVETDDRGHLIITYSDGTKTDVGYIGAEEPPVLNAVSLVLPKGDTFRLTTNRTSVFSSSDTAVLTVSSDGRITALSEGNAIVTATAEDGKKSECAIVVVCYTYTALSDGRLEITGYTGTNSSLTIPSDIKGTAVVSIGKNAFSGNTTLASVIIPTSVTSVGEGAFSGCTALTSVVKSDSTVCAANSFEGTPYAESQIQKFVLATGSSNIRSAPEFDDNNIIGYISTGEQLKLYEIIERVDSTGDKVQWAVVDYKGNRAYISMKYLQVVSEQTETPESYPIVSTVFGKDNGQDSLDYISNDSSYVINKETISAIGFSTPDLSGYSAEAPLVLIYHTHTSEAYSAEGVTSYDSLDGFGSSANNAENVVSLGKTLAEYLNNNGIPTVHCDTVHDADYATAYEKSAKSISDYLTLYPSIKYVIDLHRDSIRSVNNTEIGKSATALTGESMAQVMCVVGAGTAETACTRIAENLALAQALRASLNAGTPYLCRPTKLTKDKTYNQHLAEFSLLLEIGTDGNTLAEARAALSELAPKLAALIKGTTVPPETNP